jgi:hypothetical protein
VQKAPGQGWMKKCPMFRTCHAKRRSRLQKCPGSPTPATKNERSSIKEHRAPVKVDLRKPAKRDPHFARACAVEMHMGISQSASRRRQKPQATRSEDPDLTAALYSPQWSPCLGNHEKWIFSLGQAATCHIHTGYLP